MTLVLRSEKNGVLFPYDHNLAQLEHVTVLDYATMKPLKNQPHDALTADYKVAAVAPLDLTPQAAPALAVPQQRRRNSTPLTVDTDG